MPSAKSRTSGKTQLALAASAVGVALLVRRTLARFELRGKVVIVTGGSRGLGLVLARQLALKGAHLAICARDALELAGAEQELRELGAEVFAVACDVSDEEQARILIDQTLRHFGRIDVLINNAGIIQVGPHESMGLNDFREALATNFWGTVQPTLAVLPHMKRQRAGRIVNITSIGGSVAVPHLLPYSCSKFAATGFSEGLCAEVAKDGIRVTTVVPGLMRTGSFVNALFKGRREQEMAWFTIGATLPGLAMSAERAARRILLACELGESHVTVGIQAKALRLFHGIFPGLTARTMGLVTRLLPAPGDTGPQDAAEPGWQHRPAVAREGPLARLGNEAARRNREVPWAPPEPA
jgi:NAD(P)-dependent dehydrogenase (short-subunit alcohol dehydrogenase family)